MDKLQRIKTIYVALYTATEFLREEIRSSTTIARDIKNKWMHYKYASTLTNNSLLREIVGMDVESITELYKEVQL